MSRILFIGENDWAHMAHRIARSLCHAGHEARVCVARPHVFGYSDSDFVALSTWDATRAWVRQAPVDWYISSGDGNYDAFFKMVTQLPAARAQATMHVGTAYRTAYTEYNKIDEQRFACRIIGGDLYRFAEGAPGAFPMFAPPHVVLDKLPLCPDPVRFAHAPSRRSVKGTASIVEAVPDVEVLEGLPFHVCMQRRMRCHGYIDQLNDLGGYGAAAVEALATGAVVLGSTSNISVAVDTFYERPPIVEVTRETLGVVATTLRAQPERVAQLRARSLAWAQRVAAPAAVGAYVARHLGLS